MPRSRVPRLPGFTWKGHISRRRTAPRGAHPRADVIAASLDDFKRRQDAAGGRIVLVTLAPEVPGATGPHRVSRRVRCARGHRSHGGRARTDPRRRVCAAQRSPRIWATAARRFLPRHPNILWEQLAADALFASLIVDGHHLPAATVKSMVRAKGPRRTILVTDAVAAAGCAPGRYTIGGVACALGDDGRVTLDSGACRPRRSLAGNAASRRLRPDAAARDRQHRRDARACPSTT